MKKDSIVFFVILFIFSICGKSRTSPNPFLFKVSQNKQGQNAYETGRFFISDQEERKSSNEDILQRCALDLCGPPKTSLHSYSASNIEQMVQADLWKKWEEEFHALVGIREIIEEWVEERMEPLDSLLRDFQKRDLFRNSGFDYLQPEDYEKLSHVFFGSHIQRDIDHRRPLSNRLILRIIWPKEDSKQIKGVQSYLQDLKQRIESSLVIKVSYGVYTGMEAYNILMEKWEGFVKKYQKEKELNDKFDNSKAIAEKMNEMEEIMQELTVRVENFSEGDSIGWLLEEVADTLDNLEENFIAEKTGSWPEKKLLCQQEVCRKALEEMITELFSYYETSLSKKDKVDYQLGQCLSKFIVLKQLERELPKRLSIPYLKRNFLEKSLKDFSPATRKSFENYISNDFYIGLSVEHNLSAFKSLLENYFEWNKRFPFQKESDFDNKVREVDNEVREIDNVELITEMHHKKFYLKKELYPFCEFNNKGVDLFIPEDVRRPFDFPEILRRSKANLTLSFFSALHPYYGRGIVSHEMGHVLSWMFIKNKLSDDSYGPYKKLRECATRRYKHLNAPSRFFVGYLHENDQWNTEEDTADMIAYLATSDRREKYYSCSRLHITEDGANYKNLSILHNYNLKSEHSSDFLRVIFEAIHKRAELSPACQQIVDQHKEDIDFEPCF